MIHFIRVFVQIQDWKVEQRYEFILPPCILPLLWQKWHQPLFQSTTNWKMSSWPSFPLASSGQIGLLRRFVHMVYAHLHQLLISKVQSKTMLFDNAKVLPRLIRLAKPFPETWKAVKTWSKTTYFSFYWESIDNQTFTYH